MTCKHLHIINSFTVNASGGNITLNFSVPITSLTDKERFCFKIPCGVSIPSGADGYIVLISYNGATIPLWDKYGNPATFNELSKGKLYKGYYGATTPHIISSDLPKVYNCGCKNVM